MNIFYIQTYSNTSSSICTVDSSYINFILSMMNELLYKLHQEYLQCFFSSYGDSEDHTYKIFKNGSYSEGSATLILCFIQE